MAKAAIAIFTASALALAANFYVYDEAGQPNPACQTARAAHQLKPLMPLPTLQTAQKQTAEA
ncbi:hypothetical protein [Deefgea sp. CFH1-16]|uniref:hypothetical protein n=1 Tax=Deefgea sp. CFH1-16 TaxID=2675457 RepID=UPI0019402D4A|nr:hypothetical protein [Deefgea sp. CFH1-16]